MLETLVENYFALSEKLREIDFGGGHASEAICLEATLRSVKNTLELVSGTIVTPNPF